MKLEVIKYNNYAEPQRAHYNDSGADVFSAIDCVIEPFSIKAIPLGLGVNIPDGYDLVVHSKSGLSKRGIWSSNAPIDAGYKGEIHAILYNTTSEPFKVERGMKVGQFVMRPVIYTEFVDSLDNSRGSNGFGSTGDR